jgi:phasin family protein
MFTAPEQFTDFNKSSIDTVLQFAKISFDAAERLMNLQLQATKESVDQVVRNLKTIAEARDPQQLLDVRNQLTEGGVERVTAYSRSVYDVASHAQSQLSQLIEGRLSELSQSVTSGIDKAVKSAPPGAEVGIAAMKSAVAATTDAVDGFTKAAKQVASFADANVKSSTMIAETSLKPANGGPKAPVRK